MYTSTKQLLSPKIKCEKEGRIQRMVAEIKSKERNMYSHVIPESGFCMSLK